MSQPNDPTRNIESHLVENRVFPPPAEFARAGARRLAWRSTTRFTSYPSNSRTPSGPEKPANCTGARRGAPVLEWKRAVCQVVRRRAGSTSRKTAWTATSTARAATSPPSSGRANPATQRTLTYARTARGGVPIRQRAQGARRRRGRPRAALPAAGARGGRGHAGVRAHRRGAFGGVRRVQRGVDQGPARRQRRADSSSPPTAAGGAARSCRSRPTSMPRSRTATATSRA